MNTVERKLFFVEIKDMAGEFEPVGIMPFREAVELQFKKHRAARLQPLNPKEKSTSSI